MLYKEDFGEGKNIEFKREIPKRHEKLLKDVIAFSNSTGGKIFIGIEDKTNEVIGIGEKNPFTLTSKEGDGSYQEFLNNESRYTRLIKPFPERAERLFNESEKVAKARYEHLQRLVELYK